MNVQSYCHLTMVLMRGLFKHFFQLFSSSRISQSLPLSTDTKQLDTFGGYGSIGLRVYFRRSGALNILASGDPHALAIQWIRPRLGRLESSRCHGRLFEWAIPHDQSPPPSLIVFL